MGKQFGGKVSAKVKAKYEQSENWKNNAFQNYTETKMGVNIKDLPGIIRRQIKGHKLGNPKNSLPIQAFNHEDLLNDDHSAKFVWYSHSVLLMRVDGLTILIDPMLGDDASPIAPKKTRRFSENSINVIDDLPDIDLMLISHDHYDHLDLKSIVKLKDKVKNYYVALGVKRHLKYWGIAESTIEEFDWWDKKHFNGIAITFTPTRHFSGRGLSSMGKCLWGGWALKTASENIWFSGDGGYANHFKDVGERLGPFDIAFMECGQYCPDWKDIHMFPDESVQAALEANVGVAIPVHWGAFNLSYHHAWFEPVEDFVKFAHEQNLNFKTPAIGQVFDIDTTTSEWWKAYK